MDSVKRNVSLIVVERFFRLARLHSGDSPQSQRLRAQTF